MPIIKNKKTEVQSKHTSQVIDTYQNGKMAIEYCYERHLDYGVKIESRGRYQTASDNSRGVKLEVVCTSRYNKDRDVVFRFENRVNLDEVERVLLREWRKALEVAAMESYFIGYSSANRRKDIPFEL